MLDYFAIFTKGGALLWAFQLTALKGDPLNALVRECLLEDRSVERSYTYNAGVGGGYTLKWSFNNVCSPPSTSAPRSPSRPSFPRRLVLLRDLIRVAWFICYTLHPARAAQQAGEREDTYRHCWTSLRRHLGWCSWPSTRRCSSCCTWMRCWSRSSR